MAFLSRIENVAKISSLSYCATADFYIFSFFYVSVVDYPEVATLQNWRPVSTWGTTSRLPHNKGKYVFTSRQNTAAAATVYPPDVHHRRASIEENGGQLMSVITAPHMHFATMPRRPMHKVIFRTCLFIIVGCIQMYPTFSQNVLKTGLWISFHVF